MQQSVLIFEPCLGAISGHWENLAETLTESFSKIGFNIIFFGNKNQTKLYNKNLSIKPHFEILPYEDYNMPAIMQSAKKNYLHSFLSIDIDSFGSGEPLLVFPTIYPPILEAALTWLMKLVEYNKIKPQNVIFIFQFPFSTNSSCQQIQLLKTSPFRQLYAVSEKLAASFQEQFLVPLKELPMPIPRTTLPAFKQKDHKKPLKIGYFGHASIAKGFFFLHPLTQQNYSQPVEFHYHLNTNPETELAAEVFKKPVKNIHCYWGHLSKQEMTHLMSQMDILLLPYNSCLYSSMPSAMFSEACLLGKVLVVPTNTWLYEQAKLFQTGFTSFANHTLKSIHEALILAISQYEHLSAMNETARQKFHKYHNADNFVDIILKDKVMDKETVI